MAFVDVQFVPDRVPDGVRFAVLIDLLLAGTDIVRGLDSDEPSSLGELLEQLPADSDLMRAAAGATNAAHIVLGALANARPLVSRIAAQLEPDDDVVFVCAGDDGRFAIEDAYVAGVLARMLLDEQVDGGATLTDAAGAAVTIAASYPDAVSAVSSGHVARRLTEMDQLTSAGLGRYCEQNVTAAVPVLSTELASQI